MLENKQLLQEEIKELQEFNRKELVILQNLGYLEIMFEQQKVNLKTEYISIKSQQDSFAKILQEKYGEGNIDLETGLFTPIQS